MSDCLGGIAAGRTAIAGSCSAADKLTNGPAFICATHTAASMIEPTVIGNAALYLGDCRDILPQLASESVEMVWTDPPYGHSNNNNDLNAALATGVIDGRRESTPVAISNDNMEDMRAVVDAALTQAARILKRDSCCCCCCCGGGGPRPTFAWLAQRMDSGGFDFFHSVIWDKINPGLGWRYRRQHEMIMVAHRKGGKLSWSGEQPPIPNVLSVSKPRGKEHPNLKPPALIDRFISAHTLPGQTVLDPFMGSGTTGVSAAGLGRAFVGIEVEPKYFDIACRRIETAQQQQRMIA